MYSSVSLHFPCVSSVMFTSRSNCTLVFPYPFVSSGQVPGSHHLLVPALPLRLSASREQRDWPQSGGEGTRDHCRPGAGEYVAKVGHSTALTYIAKVGHST